MSWKCFGDSSRFSGLEVMIVFLRLEVAWLQSQIGYVGFFHRHIELSRFFLLLVFVLRSTAQGTILSDLLSNMISLGSIDYCCLNAFSLQISAVILTVDALGGCLCAGKVLIAVALVRVIWSILVVRYTILWWCGTMTATPNLSCCLWTGSCCLLLLDRFIWPISLFI